jgi:integrase
MPRKQSERLYQRGGGRWYADLRDIGGGREAMRPPSETYATTDYDVAVTLLSKRIEAIEEQRRTKRLLGVQRTTTIGHFANEWIDYRLTTENRPATLRRYQSALLHLFKVLDDSIEMTALSVADVKAAMAALRSLPSRTGGTLSGSSRRHVLVAARQMFDHAASVGVVPPGHNPWKLITKADRPKVARSTTAFLEIDEAAALIEAAGRIRGHFVPLRTVVATLLLTGGRKEEILGLEVRDLDFRRGVVIIRPNEWRDIKAGDERSIPMWPQLAGELKSYMAESGVVGGLLFPARCARNATQQKKIYGKVYKQIRDAAALAGITKHVTPRVFRTTYCAARLQSLDNGHPVAPYTVQREMGHGSMDMINRVYGRLGQFRPRTEGVAYFARPDEPKIEKAG